VPLASLPIIEFTILPQSYADAIMVSMIQEYRNVCSARTSVQHVLLMPPTVSLVTLLLSEPTTHRPNDVHATLASSMMLSKSARSATTVVEHVEIVNLA